MWQGVCKRVTQLICHRFAANGWPIATSGTEGLGVEVRTLLISAALGNMGTATSAKIAGGLLDTYAALQLVPLYSDSSSSSTSSESDSFGTTPEATPEATNAFESSSSAQSSEFSNAASPAPAATTAPLSASQQAVSSAVQAAAVTTVNTTVNATSSVFGQSQAVVFGASGSSYLAPAEAPTGYGLGEAHIEVTGPNAAPALAPAAAGAPVANAGPSPSKSRKAYI